MLSPDTIRELIERGSRRSPALTKRLERAAFLLLMRRIEAHPEGGWTVESETEVGKVYRVTDDACECPDFQWAPHGYCKHRLAVMMQAAGEALEAKRRREQTRERISDERVSVHSALAFGGAAV